MLRRSAYTRSLLEGTMREYIIDKVKRPLVQSILKINDKLGYLGSIWYAAKIIRLCMRYPEPTREDDDLKPNTYVLFDIWDEFFKRLGLPYLAMMFRAIRRITLGTYEHDPFEEDLFNWWVEQLAEVYNDGSWQHRQKGRPPPPYWNEEVVSVGGK